MYFFALIYVCRSHLFLALILLALRNAECCSALLTRRGLFPKSTATTQNAPTKPCKYFALDLGTPVMEHFSEGKIKA